MPTPYAFSLPREGSGPEEYEDAFKVDVSALRFAIADGATESAYSKLWAQLLVDEWVRSPPVTFQRCNRAPKKERIWNEWLRPLQRRWCAQVDRPNLPWYAERSIRRGAFAAFLGVYLSGKKWYAVAVGDACLFHVRNDQLVKAFPLTHSKDFSNSPALVASRPNSPCNHRFPLEESGSYQEGDLLFLMTDAVAAWFLAKVEQGFCPWRDFSEVLHCHNPEQTFANMIGEARRNREMRNDDVTVVVVEF